MERSTARWMGFCGVVFVLGAVARFATKGELDGFAFFKGIGGIGLILCWLHAEYDTDERAKAKGLRDREIKTSLREWELDLARREREIRDRENRSS